MSLRADDVIDRRRLRRKVTFWRAAALIIIAAAVVAIGYNAYPSIYKSPHIAQLRIEGTIFEDKNLIETIGELEKSRLVKGVIVSINSPGGTTTGGEVIFNALRKLAAKKPVAAQVGGLAASAGYMIASASDHIVAHQSSIVGSIGVLVQFPEVSELLDKIGVKVETIKSTPLKAEPSPFHPASEEARRMIQSLIGDNYNWFVELVAERRKLEKNAALALADGSIYSGRQALERKLIDELGGIDEAKSWLGTRGVDTDLLVVEWVPRQPSAVSPFSIKSLLDVLSNGRLIQNLKLDHILLDGLVSVWQPERSGMRN